MKNLIVYNIIKNGDIIWVKNTSGNIHICKVENVYKESNQAMVFCFEEWSQWLIDFNNIIRIGIRFYKNGLPV